MKVWPAIVVTNLGFAYSFYSYVAANYSVEQMSPIQIGAFLTAMAAGFYLHNIKCERCKMRWYETGTETYEDAPSMLSFAYRFVTQRNYSVVKKCRICGLARY